IRKEAALSVSRRVSDLVHEMEMPHAVVTLRLEASEPSATGLDRASVVFASSAQQELRLANKVASGGELARIALAMAVLSGGRTDVTLIFDELDAGLGGESAARVGSLLQQLGKDHQVVAISHQPSVAARAADQWVVARTAEDTIVRALVKRVQGVEREREIARMLSGQVDSVAMGHARHLLGEGEEVD
ncbi:MAG: DNA repair protein RecN, partial [Sulfobacillus thermotolerans]|nr:DNA repair protein RecN [Sulfobacillus thermotolerans]